MVKANLHNQPALSASEPRQLALKALIATVIERRSASHLIEQFVFEDKQQQAFARMLYLETLRFYPRLCRLADSLLKKPLKAKDLDVYLTLVLGIAQLQLLSVADHAAISETVNLCRLLQKDWACGLVNGVLRNMQRQADKLHQQLQTDPIYQTAHPGWMVKKIRQSWPQQADAVFAQNNQQPPLCLRINPLKTSRKEYQQLLSDAGYQFIAHPYAKDALISEQSLDITRLPGFAEGCFVVQDAAAQLAMDFLQPRDDETVLDACAAPGGKTTHILQTAPGAAVTALDISSDRLDRVQQNLARLSQRAHLVTSDLLATDQWWNGQLFDRILLDAPCSATGVIRRNPDIKIHRRQRDINKLAQLQAKMLDCCWSMLKPGGVLVYATCSIMPAENERQIEHFLTHTQARVIPIPAHLQNLAKGDSNGLQILPGEAEMDGFYLCALQKPLDP